jgi:estrone sulfotransferase
MTGTIAAMTIADKVKSKVAPPLLRLQRGPYFYNEDLFPRISADDVYLMNHPRSGSSWLRCLVTSYVRESPITPELVAETVPGAYRPDLKHPLTPKTAQTVLIRSHAPYMDIPARVIYLMRDGRDALMSFYAIRKRTEPPSSWVHSVSPGEFLLASTKWGPWHEHVLGWLNGLETWSRDRYLVVRYEDLVREPARELGTIVEFLGFTSDADRLEQAVAWNTKQELRAIDAEAGGGAIAFPGLTKDHWSTTLTAEEIARYEKMAGEALRRGGYALSSETSATASSS